MKEIEGKGIIEWITSQIVRILNLEPLTETFNSLVSKEYQEGIEKVEVQFDMNFVTKQETLQLLQTTMMDSIKNQGLTISHRVKGELQRWKLNDENIAQAKKRIKEAMSSKSWKHNVKTTIRTETLRSNNAGAFDGAKQSGLQIEKYLDVTMDNVTSDICKAENKKYGDPSKSIPLDQEFVVTVKNKTYRAQYPPFHPNCRTVIRFKRVDQ